MEIQYIFDKGKQKKQYYCGECKFKSIHAAAYKAHIHSNKHIYMLTGDPKYKPGKCDDNPEDKPGEALLCGVSGSKYNPTFKCEKCKFKCSTTKDYNRHLSTQKHKTIHDIDTSLQKERKCECGKVFKGRNGLWYHKKICKVINPKVDEETVSPYNLEVLNAIKELVRVKDEQIQLLEEKNKTLEETNKTVEETNQTLLVVIDTFGKLYCKK
jgi:hypothetical protein